MKLAAQRTDRWSVGQARELYRIAAWSEGYFDVGSDGQLYVRAPMTAESGGYGKGNEGLQEGAARPDRDEDTALARIATANLYALAREILAQGTPLPALVRFPDVLADRVRRLQAAFQRAKREHAYGADYWAVYPVKVNQQRSVVETVARGRRIGLEVGSKAELLMVLALAGHDMPIVCNGYKDHAYLRLCQAGARLGLTPFVVVEKLTELRRVLQLAEAEEVALPLGLRVRLHSVAAGNWQNTGGEKSKFGLHPSDVLRAVAELRSAGRLDRLRLLHFHIGSQVADIEHFRRALREGARYYAELHRMGTEIEWVDVGGGLGVDYDGTRSSGYFSLNYSLQEYADTVVRALAAICRERDLPEPRLITECGRAMTAHHAMLIMEAIDVERAPDVNAPLAATSAHPAGIVADVAPGTPGRRRPDPLQPAGLNRRNAARVWRAAGDRRKEAHEKFLRGRIGIAEWAGVERAYYALCRRARTLLDAAGPPETESETQRPIRALEATLVDKYFCNFSLFQSLPDTWALGQVFPIVPLHRLDEPPSREVAIYDVTCDSDGRIERYVGADTAAGLPLHDMAPDETGERYLLGVFLLGAYQEVLGDMHNLFGNPVSLDVDLTGTGWHIRARPGETAGDLLARVGLGRDRLEAGYRQRLRQAGLPPAEERELAAFFRRALCGTTYPED